jgi:hypothetical protein
MVLGIVHDLGICLAQFDIALHPQADHASLGFMRNIRRFHFKDYWIADLPRRSQCYLDSRRALLSDSRHLPMRQEASRLVLG